MLWRGDAWREKWQGLPFCCPVAKQQETAEDIKECLIDEQLIKSKFPPPTSLQNEQLNRVDFTFNSFPL